MSTTLEIIIASYGCLLFSTNFYFFFGWFNEKNHYKYNYYASPKDLYESSKMNIFGVILSSIGIFIICPTYYIFLFTYWICHIGRKEL